MGKLEVKEFCDGQQIMFRRCLHYSSASMKELCTQSIFLWLSFLWDVRVIKCSRRKTDLEAFCELPGGIVEAILNRLEGFGEFVALIGSFGDEVVRVGPPELHSFYHSFQGLLSVCSHHQLPPTLSNGCNFWKSGSWDWSMSLEFHCVTTFRILLKHQLPCRWADISTWATMNTALKIWENIACEAFIYRSGDAWAQQKVDRAKQDTILDFCSGNKLEIRM